MLRDLEVLRPMLLWPSGFRQHLALALAQRGRRGQRGEVGSRAECLEIFKFTHSCHSWIFVRKCTECVGSGIHVHAYRPCALVQGLGACRTVLLFQSYW